MIGTNPGLPYSPIHLWEPIIPPMCARTVLWPNAEQPQGTPGAVSGSCLAIQLCGRSDPGYQVVLHPDELGFLEVLQQDLVDRQAHRRRQSRVEFARRYGAHHLDDFPNRDGHLYRRQILLLGHRSSSAKFIEHSLQMISWVSLVCVALARSLVGVPQDAHRTYSPVARLAKSCFSAVSISSGLVSGQMEDRWSREEQNPHRRGISLIAVDTLVLSIAIIHSPIYPNVGGGSSHQPSSRGIRYAACGRCPGGPHESPHWSQLRPCMGRASETQRVPGHSASSPSSRCRRRHEGPP